MRIVHTINRKEVLPMTNPCLECSMRNVVCTAEQLFINCTPWDEYETAMLEKLIDGSILAVPNPRRKRRWFDDMVSSITNRLGA